jgi:glycosyltransferase involved in cell wall biosynthesis
VFDAGFRFDISLGTQAGDYAIGSDTELTRRLVAAGYACWFCPDAIVFRFIRRHQVRTPFILKRAWRVGRGAQLRGSVIGDPYKTMFLGLWRAFGALARIDRNELLRQRWELAYLRGYLYQAWFGGGLRLTRGTRVLIASGSPQPGAVMARMAHAARLLTTAGCDASVATERFAGQPEYAQLLRDDGVYVSVFDAPRFAEQRQWRRTRQWATRLLCARRLRRYQSDLLHVAFGGGDCASLLWLAWQCKLPAVLSVYQALPPPHLQAWLVPTYAQAFGAVRGVHAASPSAMASFMAGFGRFVPATARLCVIPDSVDTARFIVCAERRAAARARHGLAEENVVLGSMAPLEPDQRPEALVELFCALHNRFGQLRLVLSATGVLEAALRAKVELLGLGAQVIFCSPAEPLEHTLPAFDLHLALGRGDPGTILAAMACGVPAVALDMPGCSADILRAGQGGVLLAAGDQRAVIDAVGALVADAPRRAALALLARADIEANHTPELLAKRVSAFYAGLLP